MILLFLLPFYDRSPERRTERRPIAIAAGIVDDPRDGVPDLLRAPPPARRTRGRPEARRPSLTEQEASSRPCRQARRRRSPAAWPATRSARTATTDRVRRSRTSAPSCRPPRSRATLRQPDGADALVQGPRQQHPQKFNNLVNFLASSSSDGGGRYLMTGDRFAGAGQRPRHASGDPGAGDVRPHRGPLRPDEHGHDGRPAPPLARAARRTWRRVGAG